MIMQEPNLIVAFKYKKNSVPLAFQGTFRPSKAPGKILTCLLMDGCHWLLLLECKSEIPDYAQSV